MAGAELEGVWRRFGSFAAVADLTLNIRDGEFLVLLGPSGCGKTTSLRMLAGLERPTEGVIRLDGRVVNDVAPGDRDTAMVFQSYALYPHMTVSRNLSFGPRVRGEDRTTIAHRVEQVAGVLGLENLLNRRPSELSGGQRQRVALGRAMLRQPKLFLMDEPLSNLDAALRGQVRAELIRLHQKLGVTTVYVTHDQTEAMAMADRIAVMFDGRLQQAASPEDIFDDPVNLMVATFIGSPKMNLVSGSLQPHDDGRLSVKLLGSELFLPAGARLRPGHEGPQDVTLGIRPTDFALGGGRNVEASEKFTGIVDLVEPMGAETFVALNCADQILSCRVSGREHMTVGEQVAFSLDRRFIYAFDPATGVALIDRSGFATRNGRGKAD